MKKVLIIDDCPEITRFFKRFVRKLFYAHIDVCCDVHDLQEFLEINDYDVILTDLGMPYGGPLPILNGYAPKDACIVIVSAMNVDKLIQAQNELIDEGFERVDWLQKPITLDKLKGLLENE
jgi:DNA-binding NtrC family response regulator